MPTVVSDPRMVALLTGARRAARSWPGLRVEYAWRPPFEGESVTQPNRLEVVFSAHDAVELGHGGRVHTLSVEAGAGYVVGGRAHGCCAAWPSTATRWRSIPTWRWRAPTPTRRGSGASSSSQRSARRGSNVVPARRGAARRCAPAAAGGGRAGRAVRHRDEHAGAPAGPAGAGAPGSGCGRCRRRRSIREHAGAPAGPAGAGAPVPAAAAAAGAARSAHPRPGLPRRRRRESARR